MSDFSLESPMSQNDALYLIRREVAVMKRLNHPNLVQLFEVLDDPEEDSLYMVLEMCKKGVVMKVGLGEQAIPHPENMCRTWFRDLILGIEYCEYHLPRDATRNGKHDRKKKWRKRKRKRGGERRRRNRRVADIEMASSAPPRRHTSGYQARQPPPIR